MDEALEGELADQEVRGLLVATDLTEGYGARTVPAGLLVASADPAPGLDGKDSPMVASGDPTAGVEGKGSPPIG